MINRMLDLRHPKSRGHYHRSNGILFTPYPTLHKLSVGIIGVDREVQVELSNQGSWRRMVYIHQRQPAPMLKISHNFWVKLNLHNFSLSLHRSKNVQLLIGLLVFLTEKPLTIKSWSKKGGGCPMGSSLPNHDAKERKGQTEKRQKKKKEKPKGRLHQTWLEHKKIEKKIYMMHEQNNRMMHALMHLRIVQLYFKKHRIGLIIEFQNKNPNFEKPNFKNPNRLINISLHKLDNSI